MSNTGAESPSDIVERLTRIETKFDLWISQQADHETRIRTLEKDMTSHEAINKWKATVGLAMLLAAVPLVMQVIELFNGIH